jgi:magnesium transporter
MPTRDAAGVLEDTMIHTLYFHGDEVPAAGLTPAQVRAALSDAAGVQWVDLENPSAEDAASVLGEVFGFHPLTIEDCLNDEQRPKLDDFGDYVFVVARAQTREMLVTGRDDAIEVDLYLGRNYVVTVHEDPLPTIAALREAAGRDARLLARGADRLAALCLEHLADGIVDALDHVDAELEAIEDALFNRPDPTVVNRLFQVRHQLVTMRRVVGPQREVINRLAWDSFTPVRPESRLYFREVYDRVVLSMDLADSRRDLATSLLETYLSVVSNRLNETMRLLTALQMIFLPMTLIASIYGMNFLDMPPFGVPGGWVFAWVAMVAVAATMALIFRWRRWL